VRTFRYSLVSFVRLAVIVCLALVAACTPKGTANPGSTREITDDAGRRVSIPSTVDRVVSLAPNLTEIVFAIGAGNRLVGRTSYCDFPPEAKAVAEVGDTLHPNLERMIAVKPQVVLVSTASQLEVFTQQLNGQNISVNGARVTPRIENGYVTIARTWKAGDRIELELPMTVQRVYASEKIEANRGRVALRYGPLVYNLERVDQDLDGALLSSAPLKTEWRPGLLNGVTVITGKFTNGAPLLAIPNYARYNRNPPAPPYVPPPRPAPGQAAAPPPPRPAPPPPESIVWMREG